jgi:hypothetical protein
MAMTPEGKVKAKVRKKLDEAKAYYFMPATGGYGKSGVPDIVACVNGWFIGIECKAGTNKPTALQQNNLNAIKASGGTALVINENNINELEDCLNQIKKGQI